MGHSRLVIALFFCFSMPLFTRDHGGGSSDLDRLLDQFGRSANDLVSQAAIGMDQVRVRTEAGFFRSSTVSELNQLHADGVRTLEDLRRSASDSLHALTESTRSELVRAGFRQSDFTARLNVLARAAKAELNSSFKGYTYWLNLQRRDAQASFVQDKVVHIEILVILQYAGTTAEPGEDPTTDEFIAGSADARGKELEEQEKKVVKVKSDTEKDVLDALKDAKKEADKIIKDLADKKEKGEICSIEFFGHGVPSGGLRLPKPIGGVNVLGGFGGVPPTGADADALGGFLGTIKAILDGCKDAYAFYHSCWSALRNPRRDIATLTAGFTGIPSSGYTGICLFPALEDPDTRDRTFFPPKPERGSRVQPVPPSDGEKEIKDRDVLSPGAKKQIEDAIKNAVKAFGK